VVSAVAVNDLVRNDRLFNPVTNHKDIKSQLGNSCYCHECLGAETKWRTNMLVNRSQIKVYRCHAFIDTGTVKTDYCNKLNTYISGLKSEEDSGVQVASAIIHDVERKTCRWRAVCAWYKLTSKFFELLYTWLLATGKYGGNKNTHVWLQLFKYEAFLLNNTTQLTREISAYAITQIGNFLIWSMTRE